VNETANADALRRVLVPLDGSAAAEGILDAVQRLIGASESATVYLLRVLETPQGGAAADTAIEEARAYLEQVAQRFRCPHCEFEAHVRPGEAASEILSLSEEVQADLIAMSTHGRSGVERWIRGSVAERVLRNSRVPLLIVNPFDATRWETGFQRVLVPLDGSERALAALPLAESVARRFESNLVLLHAIDPDGRPGDMNALQAQVARLEERGFQARLDLPQGSAEERILDAVEQDGAQLLVMTSHGMTGLARWAYGSVAEKVLRHCRCPLLLVPQRSMSQ